MRYLLILLFLFVISGCESSSTDSSANSSAKPSVEYGGDVQGDNDITKYTNSDWLYQNYFGEYGLPDELKMIMMPELMMLANGFALQHSLGEDVNSSIVQFHTDMQMAYMSGQLHAAMSQLEYENNDGVYQAPDLLAAEEEIYYNPSERIIDADAQANIEHANKLEEQYVAEQQALVEQHNLPYPLPNRITKLVIYNQSMKGGDNPDNGCGKGCSNQQNNQENKKHVKIEHWNWWDADIIWSNGGKIIKKVRVGHMGLVDDKGTNDARIIDANVGVGVRIHENMEKWADKYSRIEGLYYTPWGRGHYKRQNIVNYAINQRGRGYGLLVGKNSSNDVYCSLFVYQAFWREGVNLDKDGGWTVWPDDIRYHPSIRKFNSSSL